MASIDDVERFALALPQVEESTWFNNRAWKVQGKAFVWVRPLSKKDCLELGEAAPAGETVGVRVADAGDKQAALEGYEATVTINHLRNFDAVLIDLERVDVGALGELIEDAWLSQASPTLVAEFLGHGERE